MTKADRLRKQIDCYNKAVDYLHKRIASIHLSIKAIEEVRDISVEELCRIETERCLAAKAAIESLVKHG